MFDNIGKKFKRMAKVHSLLYIIYNIVLGFILFTVEELAFLGLVLILVGIFGTPIVAFFLYGFGEIIDRITEISLNVRNNVTEAVIINVDEKTKLDRVSDFMYFNRGKLLLGIVLFIIIIIGIMFAFFSVSVSNGYGEGAVNASAATVKIEYKG